MKVSFKQVTAIVLAVAMILSLSLTSALAVAGNGTLALRTTNVTSSGPISEGDVFKITITATSTDAFSGLKSAEVYLKYDSTIIAPCDKDGNVLTSWNTSVLASTIPTTHFVQTPSISAGKLGLSILKLPGQTDIPVANKSIDIVSFYFKTAKVGTTSVELDTDAGDTIITGTENEVNYTFNALSVTVNEKPVAPTATNLSITEPTVRLGGTATAAFTFADANVNDKEGTHIYKWFVNDEEVTGATAKTFTPSDAAYVGKTLTFSVMPKSDNAGDPAATEVKLETGITIKAPENYKPVVAPTYPTKITAGKAAIVTITPDATYTSEDETVVNWYVVDTAATEIGEEQEAAFEDSTTATFEKDLKGKFVIIEVIPGANVADEPFVGDAVYSTPIEIKSSTPKPSGGSTGPGTTLPGVLDEKPVDPKPIDPKPEQSADKFTDFAKTKYSWAFDAVDKLVKEGVIEGKDEETFDPEGTTTNAEFVAMVIRAMGIKTEAAASGEHWAKNIIAAAKEKGLLDYTTSFESDGKISREEMFTILYKALLASNKTLEKGEVSEFTDAASISDFAKEATGALIKAGIVNGMGDGTVAPKGTATRAQVATVIFRAFFK